MDLSFIICTYNGAARLPDTLAHLLAQRNDADNQLEIVVVDNASTDGTGEVVRAFASDGRLPVRLISEPTPGKTHALRTGLREASGRYFTLVDDDNHLCPEWADIAVDFMDGHPGAGLIGGKILPKFAENTTLPPDFDQRYRAYLAIRDYGDEPLLGREAIGAGMTGRTDLMRRLYGEMISYLTDRVGDGLGCSEDLEKSIIVSHLGWETWYVPGLSMGHFIPANRLRPDYIDRLWIESAIAGTWLTVLKDLGPTDPTALLGKGRWERRQWVVESLLSALPPVHPRLSRARFWKRCSAASIGSWRTLAARSDEVKRILNFIDAAPAELRPAMSEVHAK